MNYEPLLGLIEGNRGVIVYACKFRLEQVIYEIGNNVSI